MAWSPKLHIDVRNRSARNNARGHERAQLYEEWGATAGMDVQHGAVKKVVCGFAWVVHGFFVEYEDGTRDGSFLSDDKKPIDLYDDACINARMARWETLEDDEYILEVSGQHTNFGYLVASISLLTSKHRKIEFKGTKSKKYKGSFKYAAPDGSEIIGVEFHDGVCKGVKTRQRMVKFHDDVRIGAKMRQRSFITTVPWTPNLDRVHLSSASTPRQIFCQHQSVLPHSPWRLRCDGNIADDGVSRSAERANSSIPLETSCAVVQSLQSKDDWKAHMKESTRLLLNLMEEDYKVRGVWDYTCQVCQKDMVGGPYDHIRGAPHFKVVSNKLWNDDNDDFCLPAVDIIEREWIQRYILSEREYVFNHLTGSVAQVGPGGVMLDITEAAQSSSEGWMPSVKSNLEQPDAGAGSVKTIHDCEMDAAASSRLQKHDSARADAASNSKYNYQHALMSLEAWKLWIGPHADKLNLKQVRVYRETSRWSFTYCAICKLYHHDWVDEHLRSSQHYNSIWHEVQETDQCWQAPISVRGLCTRWVQHFHTPLGRSYFNHLTGEQRAEWDDTTEEDAIDEQTWAPLKISFGKGPPLFGYVSDRGDRFTDHNEWNSKSETRVSPGCLVSGWCSSGRGPSYVAKQRCWSRGEPSTWKVCLPVGIQITVIVGIDESDDAPKKSQRYCLDINYNRVEGTLWPYCFEESATVDVGEDGCLTITGTAPINYLYIQIANDELSVQGCPHKEWKPPAVPRFSETARGTAKHWNRSDNENPDAKAALFWGRRAKEILPDVAGAQVDAACLIYKFLESRKGPNGEDLLKRLGPPFRQDDGWFCFQWRGAIGESKDSSVLPVPPQDHIPKWRRAWHGCKLEALYSILYNGHLFESCNRSLGDRHLEGLPGVYLHKDSTAHKAENYIRFVPLCEDGILWAAKWEVRVDRKAALDINKNTDQWVQPADSVHLEALWLCGRRVSEMRANDPVARAWNPEHEAHPSESLKSRQDFEE